MTEDERIYNGLAEGLSQLLDGVRSDIATDVLASAVAYLAMNSPDHVDYANDFIVNMGQRMG